MLANLALLLLVSGDAGRAGTVMDKASLADARASVRKLADDIVRRAHRSSRPVAVVKADPAPATAQVPPPVASPFPVSSVAPEIFPVPAAERAPAPPRASLVPTATQDAMTADTAREPVAGRRPDPAAGTSPCSP